MGWVGSVGHRSFFVIVSAVGCIFQVRPRNIAVALQWSSGLVNFCCSRVYLGYHTNEQVVVGALVGGISGWLWDAIYRQVSECKIHTGTSRAHSWYDTSDMNAVWPTVIERIV